MLRPRRLFHWRYLVTGFRSAPPARLAFGRPRPVSLSCGIACAWLLAASSSHAQIDAPLGEFYRWSAGTPEEQLAMDETPIPPGQGAIFVPALSDGASEPQAVVRQGDRDVAVGLNGTRLVVPPGDYMVHVGSGPLPQMVATPVTVQAGETTIVPVTWSGLRVEVVDENNVPYRGGYELIRVADRQPYTVGFGADTLLGERLPTLLAPEGLYRVVRQGADYRSRTDFATVLLPPAGLVHYKLVIDPDTGEFRGSGVVPPAELGEVTEANPWNRRYSLGVSVPLSSSENVVGSSNQTSVGLDVFFDTYINYQRDQNVFNGILEIEEGLVQIEPEAQESLPLQKTRDRLRVDLFYTRFLNSRFGPYGRVGLLSNLFESNVLFTETRDVVRILKDGTTVQEVVPANTNFRTGESFAPLLLREGVGINARLVQNRLLVLDWRGGLGFRQNQFNDSFFLDDDPATGPLEYRQADDFNQSGVETTFVGTLRYRVLLVSTQFDLFGDFDEFAANVDWRNNVSWRLTSSLSLDYKFDLIRIPEVRDDNQITQSLLLRYSWAN